MLYPVFLIIYLVCVALFVALWLAICRPENFLAALPLDAGELDPFLFNALAFVGCHCFVSLLKLLLLTRQSAEHGAVEPQQNELPSFRDRHRSLSIVPICTAGIIKEFG